MIRWFTGERNEAISLLKSDFVWRKSLLSKKKYRKCLLRRKEKPYCQRRRHCLLRKKDGKPWKMIVKEILINSLVDAWIARFPEIRDSHDSKGRTGVNFYLFPASSYNIVDVNMVKLVRKSFMNTGIMTILFIIIAGIGRQKKWKELLAISSKC